MLNIFLEAHAGDHLYHIHDVRGIRQVALATFSHFYQVKPNESAD
jgi:hypothetical protein